MKIKVINTGSTKDDFYWAEQEQFSLEPIELSSMKKVRLV